MNGTILDVEKGLEHVLAISCLRLHYSIKCIFAEQSSEVPPGLLQDRHLQIRLTKSRINFKTISLVHQEKTNVRLPQRELLLCMLPSFFVHLEGCP